MGLIILVVITLIVNFLYTDATALKYDVHKLEGATTISRDNPSSKQAIDIYCYPGTAKTILAIWQTVQFNIKINNDEFSQYIGGTPNEVFQEYTEDSYSWSVVNPFQKKNQKTVTLQLFNSTCMAINTKQKHSVELLIQRVDFRRLLLMSLGLVLIFASRHLSGNPVFFYLCGVFIGVSASFMVIVYYMSKMLPRKSLTYGILIGGWTVGVYIFQQVWDNIRTILLSHRTSLFWYTVVVGFVSFLVCYRIGPPRNRRSQNLVMWTLQGVGVLCIFFSSEYQEAAAAIIIVALVAKYFPQSLIYTVKSYWHRKFPPKPRYLTNEEYYEQGARVTKQALDSLREHCRSPDCAQWRVMMKLNDSKRFASFVEGDSHLSDDEVLGYESYAFSLDRSRKPAGDSTVEDLEISDDDDSSDSEVL